MSSSFLRYVFSNFWDFSDLFWLFHTCEHNKQKSLIYRNFTLSFLCNNQSLETFSLRDREQVSRLHHCYDCEQFVSSLSSNNVHLFCSRWFEARENLFEVNWRTALCKRHLYLHGHRAAPNISGNSLKSDFCCRGFHSSNQKKCCFSWLWNSNWLLQTCVFLRHPFSKQHFNLGGATSFPAKSND